MESRITGKKNIVPDVKKWMLIYIVFGVSSNILPHYDRNKKKVNEIKANVESAGDSAD